MPFFVKARQALRRPTYNYISVNKVKLSAYVFHFKAPALKLLLIIFPSSSYQSIFRMSALIVCSVRFVLHYMTYVYAHLSMNHLQLQSKVLSKKSFHLKGCL